MEYAPLTLVMRGNGALLSEAMRSLRRKVNFHQEVLISELRGLLMSDTLPLTQEFLSQMLGVQRSSVTLVARKLQEAGLIRYRRGRIQVLEVELRR